MTNKPVKNFYGITDFQLYLFGQGTNSQAYKIFGCHKYIDADFGGYRFAVWAPNAKAVSLVGDFNNWDVNNAPLSRIEDTGVWVCICDSIRENDIYKYAITTAEGEIIYKADPYGYACQLRHETASSVCDIDRYKWKDKKWQTRTAKTAP